MTRRGSPWMVAFGFLGIGVVLLGIAAVMAAYVVQETRIGRGLQETGEQASALVVSAERIDRTQCSRSQRRMCTRADNLIGTVVYQVSGLRVGTEIDLTEAEFAAHQAGEDVFIDLIYLPSDTPQSERTQGARLAAAGRDTLHIYVLAVFALTFAAIGSIALLVIRKRAAPLSTGPGG